MRQREIEEIWREMERTKERKAERKKERHTERRNEDSQIAIGRPGKIQTEARELLQSCFDIPPATPASHSKVFSSALQRGFFSSLFFSWLNRFASEA